MLTGEIRLYDMPNDHVEKTNYAMRRLDLERHVANLLNKHHHLDLNWKVPDAAREKETGRNR